MNFSSIAFLICWHGDYPWYFPYFLHSCRYNPDIDFLIFTDNSIENLDLSANVKIIPYSMQVICFETKEFKSTVLFQGIPRWAQNFRLFSPPLT